MKTSKMEFTKKNEQIFGVYYINPFQNYIKFTFLDYTLFVNHVILLLLIRLFDDSFRFQKRRITTLNNQLKIFKPRQIKLNGKCIFLFFLFPFYFCVIIIICVFFVHVVTFYHSKFNY